MGTARPLPIRVQVPLMASKGRAACYTAVQKHAARPDDWFPDHRLDRWNHRAITICNKCPIKQPCLNWALRRMLENPADSLMGIWGGTTHQQRLKMVRHSYRM